MNTSSPPHIIQALLELALLRIVHNHWSSATETSGDKHEVLRNGYIFH
jgi:hypothetical protein